jgi:glycosyltransferase involved in cell wall biosynthesis
VLFWTDNLYYDKQYAKPLQDIGVEVLYGPRLVDKFEKWLETNYVYLDYIFLSRPHVAEKYLDAIVKYFTGKLVFYGHDLHYVRLESEYAITKNEEVKTEATHWKTLEKQIWTYPDIIYYPSEEESILVQAQMPNKTVRAISAYVYPDEEIAAARARVGARTDAGGGGTDLPTLMFVAGFRHRPNVDAALWLVRTILPRLRNHVPQFTTILAGSFPPPEVTALGSDDVIVTGYISDALLRNLYFSATVIVAPLRFGGGVKGKIIEALRYGVPIVTTAAGAQGMNGAEDYLGLAETADEFVTRIVELIEDPGLGHRRALAGLDYIDREYSYRSVVRRIVPDFPELNGILQNRRVLRPHA